MKTLFKDQSGPPTEASGPVATISSENDNHRQRQNNTGPRKPAQTSAHLNGNKRTALLTETTRHSILLDLKAGLSEHAIAVSHGIRESQVRKLRELHLSLVERVAAILRVHQLCAADDIRELVADTYEEEGVA